MQWPTAEGRGNYRWVLRLGRRDLSRVTEASFRLLEPDVAGGDYRCQICYSGRVIAVEKISVWGDAGGITLYTCDACHRHVRDDLARCPDPLGNSLVTLAKLGLLMLDADGLRDPFPQRLTVPLLPCAFCRTLARTWRTTPNLADFACTMHDARWVDSCAPCLLSRVGQFREVILHRERGRLAASVAPVLLAAHRDGVPRDVIGVIWRIVCGLIDFEEAARRAPEITGR